MPLFLSSRRISINSSYLYLTIPLVLTLLGIKLFVPDLIESAYREESMEFFNSILSGRTTYPLQFYLNKFRALFNIAVFFSVLFIYALFLHSHLTKNVPAITLARPGIFKRVSNLSLKERYWFFSLTALVLQLAGYLFTVYPAATYVNIMAHDTFIFFDGAYRLSQGQIPHLDFHTPLGALSYFLPYLGLSILNQLPGALEISNFIVATLILAVAVHVFSSRYRIFPSVLALLYLYLITIVPMNVGSQDITHAMFYNRYGWVCLTLLYLFVVEPEQKSRTQLMLDIACISSLLITLFYIKLTYFVFGTLFLALFSLKSAINRRIAFYSLGILFIAATILESFYPELHYRYFLDLWTAIQSSGVVREKYAPSNVLPELILLLILSYFALRAAHASFYNLCYVALVIVSSVMIINQNFQTTGLVPTIALLLWTHEASSRQEAKINSSGTLRPQIISVSTVALSFILLFVTQTLIERTKAAAELYKIIAFKDTKEYSTPLMANLYIGDRQNALNEIIYEKNPEVLFKDIKAVKRKQPLTQGEYLETIEEGYKLISNIDKAGDRVIVFDLANPFSFLLRSQPPHQDYSFYHFNRNISFDTHLKGEELFKSVSYVMIPKFPMLPSSTSFLKKIYGSYLNNNFRKITDSLAWEIYQLR